MPRTKVIVDQLAIKVLIGAGLALGFALGFTLGMWAPLLWAWLPH
jgi:hypothetical protein